MLCSRPRFAALIAVAAVAAPVVLAVPGSAEAPIAGVRVSECSEGPEASDRFVEFRGDMRQVAGSESMWMRFTLQERVGDRPFVKVRTPGLGVWRKSRPGVPRFVYRQRVLELAKGSEYRTRVRFRWYDPSGNVVEEEVRRSPSCRQGGDLPNLLVKRIRASAAGESPGVQRYKLRVVNSGNAATTGADVALAVDGAVVDTVALGPLEPGEVRRVFVNGPPCMRSARAQADPAASVIESSESDNVVTSRCPLRP